MANSSNQTAGSAEALDAQIAAVAERTERLLLRYEELTRTNALMQEQINVLSGERDNLKSRLSAARSRIDSLIDRLPAQALASEEAAP
jgi:cell division protein ZapB